MFLNLNACACRPGRPERPSRDRRMRRIFRLRRLPRLVAARTGNRTMEARINEPELDERLAALETARSWSPRVVSKLESLIRAGDDRSVFRINPMRFAAERNIAEAETIDLFLHAASLGLFDMDWLLVCPLCGCVVESFRSLRSLEGHYRCSVCHADHEAMLDDYIM